MIGQLWIIRWISHLLFAIGPFEYTRHTTCIVATSFTRRRHGPITSILSEVKRHIFSFDSSYSHDATSSMEVGIAVTLLQVQVGITCLSLLLIISSPHMHNDEENLPCANYGRLLYFSANCDIEICFKARFPSLAIYIRIRACQWPSPMSKHRLCSHCRFLRVILAYKVPCSRIFLS